MLPIEVIAQPDGYSFRYRFDDADVPPAAEMFCGLRFQRTLKPTMPFIRDREGRTVPRTKVVVNGFMLEYENLGSITAVMDSQYRENPIEFGVDFFPIDGDPSVDSNTGLRSGILHIPWGERSDWSELTLTTDDLRPGTILDLEWTGQVFRGRRE